MKRQTSYEDLLRQVKNLEKIVRESQESQRESEERFQGVLEHSFDVIYRFNLLNDKFDYMSPSLTRLLGYELDEVTELTFDLILTFVHSDDRDKLHEGFNDMHSHPHTLHEIPATFEFRLKRKSSEVNYVWISDTRAVVLDENALPIAVVGTLRDISERKQAEEELQKIRDSLEVLVQERTATLEEVNSALRILLQQREQDLKVIEEKIQLNVKQMVTPFIERFRRSELDRDLIVSLDLMESSLHEILSPFVRSLSTKYLTLTFTEIQVANLIREGKTSKEIAELLHMSERTIEAHRYHIRKKLGLRNKNANLRVHLLSMA